jgi:hypothetical protein
MNTEQNQALLALYEIESHVNPHLENINQSDPAVQYCMEQAKFHLKTAHELLEAAVLGPQTQYDDARAFHQKLAKVLPLMVLMQTYESLPPDPVEEESSPDTPSSVLSSQDIFEPVTPSRQSEI